jgi:CheY-like chemotaxis protein
MGTQKRIEVARILFVDNSLERAAILHQRLPDAERQEVCWARTVSEAIKFLEGGGVEVVMLEHDLDGELNSKSDKSGMEIVRYLESDPKPELTVVIHSWREKVANKMMVRLLRCGYRALHKPFGM